MSITAIRNIHSNDAPEMISILMGCLLFKLGGQITFTLGEIEKIHKEFPVVRFALTQSKDAELANELLTVTLNSHDHTQNDRPPDLGFPPDRTRS